MELSNILGLLIHLLSRIINLVIIVSLLLDLVLLLSLELLLRRVISRVVILHLFLWIISVLFRELFVALNGRRRGAGVARVRRMTRFGALGERRGLRVSGLVRRGLRVLGLLGHLVGIGWVHSLVVRGRRPVLGVVGLVVGLEGESNNLLALEPFRFDTWNHEEGISNC